MSRKKLIELYNFSAVLKILKDNSCVTLVPLGMDAYWSMNLLPICVFIWNSLYFLGDFSNESGHVNIPETVQSICGGWKLVWGEESKIGERFLTGS